MAKSKKKLSLHIQNDQTGTSNVSQRNSDLALVLQGPGGIEHFTNFNDKVISLSSTTPPLSAFTSRNIVAINKYGDTTKTQNLCLEI